MLPDKEEVEVHVYAYTGTNLNNLPRIKFYADAIGVDEQAEKLYYDLKVPYDVMSFTDRNSKEYVDILSSLNKKAHLKIVVFFS